MKGWIVNKVMRADLLQAKMYDHFEFFDNMRQDITDHEAGAQRMIAYHWRKKLLRIKKKRRAAAKKNHIAENKANLAGKGKEKGNLGMSKY